MRPRLCTKLCEDGVYPARVSCGVYHSALLTGDGEVCVCARAQRMASSMPSLSHTLSLALARVLVL